MKLKYIFNFVTLQYRKSKDNDLQEIDKQWRKRIQILKNPYVVPRVVNLKQNEKQKQQKQ